MVDEGCATTVGVAGLCGRAGAAGLLGLLRGGLAFQAFSMPGYLLCPLPGSGGLGLDPSFACSVSPETGEPRDGDVPGCLDWPTRWLVLAMAKFLHEKVHFAPHGGL